MTLPRITQFAGESFSTTDNVRTVYAGQEEDNATRPSRTIVLVGPIGAGKSSLIDFLCNYFYGVRFDSGHRYKIADECFDNTTPDKAVTKYVFNGTQMPYRPIVIDTPGIGDPTGLKANRELASVVTDYFNLASKERIHAVGLVLPSFMHSVNPQIDSDIKLTLSLFPDWMHSNIVPIVTYSNQAMATNMDLLRHFGLAENTAFCVDTNSIFTSPSVEPEERSRQHQSWQLTSNSVRAFLQFVGDLRPQTIEKRLLSGDATPNSPLSPSAHDKLGQSLTNWQTSISENVNLAKPEQTRDLTVLWPTSLNSQQIPLQETDEETLIREVTVITERIPSGRPSPTQSLGLNSQTNPQKSPNLGQISGIQHSPTLGQQYSPLTQQSPQIGQQFQPKINQPIQKPLGQKFQPKVNKPFGQEFQPISQQSPQIQKYSPLDQQFQPIQPLGQQFQPSQPSQTGQQFSPRKTTESQGIPLSPNTNPPLIPPHKQEVDQKDEMRSNIPYHRSETNVYPYVDEELTESSNLELLRRYIYDPSTRTYKIQYVHEVRESRRSSGHQSLRASANDIRPQTLPNGRRHAPTSGGLDDSFLGTLADELRRQGQYNDSGRLARNTSAPHLYTEYDKENALREGKNIDYSPDTLKRLLDGFGQNLDRRPDRREPTQISNNRPTVIRKPYEQSVSDGFQRYPTTQQQQQPIRVPIIQPNQQNQQPLRPLNQNYETDEYANQALKYARDQRSASHAVVDLPVTAQSPDRSFDDKDRLFERSATARQSFHNNSLRRGSAKHAIATRPDTDYADDWDAQTEESRRSSLGGKGPGLGPVPQPRTIINSQPLKHTPSGLNDGQRVRPSDLGQHSPQSKPQWPPHQPQVQDPNRRDIESGYRPGEDRKPLRSEKKPKKGKKPKADGSQGTPKNRKFPSFTKCCFYIFAPCLVIFVVGAIIITLIIIA